MATRNPTVLVLDVNETLSDLSPLRETFAALGASPETADTWFAATLRDGFALTVADARPSFVDLAADNARTLLARQVHDLDAAADQLVQAFRSLNVHPDVAEGLQDLRTLHRRVVNAVHRELVVRCQRPPDGGFLEDHVRLLRRGA